MATFAYESTFNNLYLFSFFSLFPAFFFSDSSCDDDFTHIHTHSLQITEHRINRKRKQIHRKIERARERGHWCYNLTFRNKAICIYVCMQKATRSLSLSVSRASASKPAFLYVRVVAGMRMYSFRSFSFSAIFGASVKINIIPSITVHEYDQSTPFPQCYQKICYTEAMYHQMREGENRKQNAHAAGSVRKKRYGRYCA